MSSSQHTRAILSLRVGFVQTAEGSNGVLKGGVVDAVVLRRVGVLIRRSKNRPCNGALQQRLFNLLLLNVDSSKCGRGHAAVDEGGEPGAAGVVAR